MPLTRRDLLTGAAVAGLATGLVNAAEPSPKPGHVVLLGDSIFDNKPYVGNGPAVTDQLRKTLPAGWKVTRLALDGSVAGQIYLQLENLPADATHLFVSAGGNDALQQEDVLERRINTVAEALGEISTLREKFDKTYARMLDELLKVKKPAAVCTIYDPNFKDARQQRISISALTVFNDCITRAAARKHLPVLDLRILFTQPADYANPIEPSVIGGQKIANQIARMTLEHDFASKHSIIYGTW